MHGHANPIGLLLERTQKLLSEEQAQLDKSAGENFIGFGSFLRTPEPSETVGASSDRLVLVRKLAARVGRGPEWPEPLASTTGTKVWDNPAVPAGYTYLLQLVAHDAVASSISFGALHPHDVLIENGRVQPLLLSTLYGSGPEITPHAYQFTEECRASAGRIPRTYLRVGRSQADDHGPGCPFRDIGRATPIDTSDDGMQSNEQLLSESLLADARNDDHAVISQLTVLFHKLHNHLLAKLDGDRLQGQEPMRAFRNFVATRSVVTILYHHIILNDLLRRLLHRSVFDYYTARKGTLFGRQRTISYEFALGAFRCGHAMVQDDYMFNTDNSLKMKDALQRSALRKPDLLPLDKDYIADWARFFDLGAGPVNASRRIGPRYTGVLRDGTLFPSVALTPGMAGLPARDFLSATSASMWSVPMLIQAIVDKESGLAAFLPTDDALKPQIAKWLGHATPGFFSSEFELTGDDIEQLSGDPPMPFYIAFEAACANLEAVSAPDLFRDGGQRLGPLGSIIIAETLFGAMDPHGTRAIFRPLATQIAEVAARLEVPVSTFDRVTNVSTMPKLLRYLEAESVISL